MKHRSAAHRGEKLRRLRPRLQLQHELQVAEPVPLRDRRGSVNHLKRVEHLRRGRSHELADAIDLVRGASAFELTPRRAHRVKRANVFGRAHPVEHQVVLEAIRRV
eukprot:29661-Pelagococcus_subviridis.AAC.5